MPYHNLPKALFDPTEINKAIELVEAGADFDASLLILALQDYMKRVDPTLDTYDPSRQLIAALKMKNAAFLSDSWASWLHIMELHDMKPVKSVD